MFPMQNFEPESAVISAASNSALIEKYLRNTCLGQGAVPSLIVSINRDNCKLLKFPMFFVELSIMCHVNGEKIYFYGI